MALSKYIKQPVSGSPAQYADTELRKVESSVTGIVAALQELIDMSSANFESGSFVITATGLTTAVTATVSYTKVGRIVLLSMPTVLGVSNATTFTLTGMPANLRPLANGGLQPLAVVNNGTNEVGFARVLTTGVIQLWRNFSDTGWTNVGNKGINPFDIAYIL